MKRQFRLLVSSRSSSVNNYNAREMTQRLNGSVYKAAKEALTEKMSKNIEEEVIAKLSAQFNSEWAQKKAVLKNELGAKKAVLKQARKEQSKVKKYATS